MTAYDQLYVHQVSEIMMNGIWDHGQNVRTKWEDGTPAHTKSLISYQLKFDNKEVPILTNKRVAWKTAIKELFWIWLHKSNSVDLLNSMGVHIWDEWKKPDGTIGKAYGYQLGKKFRIHPETGEYVDQVDYLIYQLKNDPSSRRHITSLWNVEDLDDMSLNPCVWQTQWIVKKNKLHLIVGIRSNDVALGQPFNVFQYYVLQRMMAQVTGYELGGLTFNINDCHIYDRHLEPLQQQIQAEVFAAPELIINPNVKNFYDFTIDDFQLVNYEHGKTISMEVAI